MEHLLHEYELDDETLQKAQLEQHKIFQNFPTSTALVAPSAPPPLATGAKPKVLSTLRRNDSDNGTRVYEKTQSPSRRRLSELLTL